jgi:hypothetical protein
MQSKLNLSLFALALIPCASLAGVPGQGTWEATLQPRDLDGNISNGAEAFYDTALNITWLRESPSATGSWFNFANWASTLEFTNAKDWRLPSTRDNGPPYSTGTYGYGGPGANTGFNVDPTTSELAHLFFVTLGNSARYDIYGNATPEGKVGFTNAGEFLGLAPGSSLWSETPYSLDNSSNWYFKGGDGLLGVQAQFSSGIGAVAVHDGDVGVSLVPELSTTSMLLLGIGVTAIAIRRTKTRQ